MTLASDNRPILINQKILKKLSRKEINYLCHYLSPLIKKISQKENRIETLYASTKSQVFLLHTSTKKIILKRNTQEISFLKDLFFLKLLWPHKLAPKLFSYIEKEKIILMEYLPTPLKCNLLALKQAFYLLGRVHAVFIKQYNLISTACTNKSSLDFLSEAQAVYENANGKFPWVGLGDIKKTHFYFSGDKALKILDFECVSTALPQVFDLISMFNILSLSILNNENKWLILCYYYHRGLRQKNTKHSFPEKNYKHIFELGKKLSDSLKKEYLL